jgi:hypothetical protein
MPPERQSGQALLVAAAEAVIVYSQPVADAFTTGFELGGPIHVVPDALATLPPAPADPDRSRLVWGALSYPQRSLAVIGTAVERLLGARPSVRLAVFWGATLWLQTWWGSERHPQIDQVSPNGLLPYLRYLDVLLGLRPGIVLHPMADQPGNELRGMSTALNAALAGAALIVSPRGLYPSHFRDGEECLFAADDDWETAIARVLDDPDLRDHLAAGLRRWVSNNALIEHTGPRWAQALGLELPAAGVLEPSGRGAGV